MTPVPAKEPWVHLGMFEDFTSFLGTCDRCGCRSRGDGNVEMLSATVAAFVRHHNKCPVTSKDGPSCASEPPGGVPGGGNAGKARRSANQHGQGKE